jgi:hypothetical protein
MRLAHINASEDQLWRWFEVPRTNARLELKLVTLAESAKFKNPKDDPEFYRRHVAKNWFRGFENLVDVNGTPIPNTEETRFEILQDRELWSWVSMKLDRSSNWWEEGKADSGSAS